MESALCVRLALTKRRKAKVGCEMECYFLSSLSALPSFAIAADVGVRSSSSKNCPADVIRFYFLRAVFRTRSRLSARILLQLTIELGELRDPKSPESQIEAAGSRRPRGRRAISGSAASVLHHSGIPSVPNPRTVWINFECIFVIFLAQAIYVDFTKLVSLSNCSPTQCSLISLRLTNS